jgi:hypothetical protein
VKVLFKLLEDLREPKRRLSAGGNSVGNGFRLNIRHRKFSRYKKNVRTCKKLEEDPTGRMLAVIVPVLLTSWAYLIYVFPKENFFLSFPFLPIGHLMVAAGFTLIMIGGPLNRLTFKGDFARWHACEHKAIMILRIGQAGTEQELRETDPVSIHCGSVFGFLISTWLMGMGGILMGYLNFWTFCAAICSGFGLTTIFGLGAQDRRLAQICAIPSFPLLLLAMTYERTFLLKEPTDKQYKKTARFIKWLYKKYPWTKHPRLRRNKTTP